MGELMYFFGWGKKQQRVYFLHDVREVGKAGRCGLLAGRLYRSTSINSVNLIIESGQELKVILILAGETIHMP